jgi:hypothetical protein
MRRSEGNRGTVWWRGGPSAPACKFALQRCSFGRGKVSLFCQAEDTDKPVLIRAGIRARARRHEAELFPAGLGLRPGPDF